MPFGFTEETPLNPPVSLFGEAKWNGYVMGVEPPYMDLPGFSDQ